ncbi:MAG: glycosyltransferase family 2 protein [Anaerolineae bacterium]
MSPAVTAIVLNWNNAPDTLGCLASLAQQDTTHRVLVVDNGSTDDSVARIAAAFPAVVILQTGANLGYAGGNNAGIRKALQDDADYLFVLNNDVTLAADCLSALVDAAQSQPRVGVVGGIVYDLEAPQRIQSAGMHLNAIGDSVHRGEGQQEAGQFAAVDEVDAVKGCAMLVSREAIAAAGVLDERYFMYLEEVDWCQRIRRAGYAVLFAPAAHIWHPETPLGDDRYVRATYYMTRNAYLLLRTRRAPLSAYAWRLARDLMWVANWTVNPKWRHKRRERDAIVYALRDALLGRWGPMGASRSRSLGLG